MTTINFDKRISKEQAVHIVQNNLEKELGLNVMFRHLLNGDLKWSELTSEMIDTEGDISFICDAFEVWLDKHTQEHYSFVRARLNRTP